MADLQNKIEELYSNPALLSEKSAQEAVESVIASLDHGELRVATKTNSGWQVNQWVKKAILLYFRISKMELIHAGDIHYFDKIPLKKWHGNEGVRVVPQALARRGAFISKGAILMPSYVNIGAFVGEHTMVDTWATVGSCAQIGERVHLSGGVGVGGVLEPLQASPVIIENDVFVGSRAILVEGVIVEEAAVIGAGVTLTASTRIIDVTQKIPVTFKGRVPARSVVIPGTTAKTFPGGDYGVPCALIIGQRSQSTDTKTSLNDVLREFELAT